jgi:hypothetical protein
VKRQLPPGVLCKPLAIALLALGCGETQSNSGAAGAHSPSDAGSGENAQGAAGPAGGSGGSAEGGAVSEAKYAGAVLALLTERDGAMTYVARAVFTAGPQPVIGGCPQCCCNSTRRGLPLPEKPPDASQITLLPAAGSTALATLVPDLFEDGYGTFHGTSELGWSWFAPLSDYPAEPSQPWNAGDTLQVVAQGNEVEAFSGTLRAGLALGGVTPPIGSSPIVASHTQPFEISWTPERQGDATVLLGIPNADGICYCDAPDSAGKLVVDSKLLSAVSGEISLARLTISNVTSGNASVDLVGGIVKKGAVEFQ